jgi:spermidine/putrescine transport system substrate-binding protein
VRDTGGVRVVGTGSGRSGTGASRRTFLKGAGLTAFGIGSAAVLPLFNTPSASQDPAKCRVPDLSASQKQLIVSNWPDYMDVAEKGQRNTLEDFVKATGIKVDYTDDVSDNAEFFAKVRNQLSYCEPIGRDLMMLTDWMAARMIGLGWIQPLTADKVPNLHKNLIKPLQGRQWDKDRTYSAPWQSGLTGIAYNAKLTKEVRSFDELLTRSDLKGKITLLSEMRDTMAFMIKIEGGDPDKFTADEWANSIDRLRKVVSAGQVRAFTGNEYIQDLSAGNIMACEAWSGDVITAQADNPDIKFVIPEEGLSLWSDNMIVPNKSEHRGNAEKWIDFYYEPEVAAKLAAYVNYICPVEGARDAMVKIDDSLVDNPLIFPSEDALKDTFDFMVLNDAEARQYEGEFSDVTGG